MLLPRPTARRLAIVALAIASGCTADPGPPGASTEALAAEARLEIQPETTHVPPGGDGATRLALTWVDPAGARTSVQLDAPPIAAVPWADAAVVLDEHRVLWRVAPRTPNEWIAANVAAPPAVSDTGLLAYAVRGGNTGVTIHLRDPDGAERTIADAVGAAGLLRFTPGRLLFVGAARGGVAGIWSIELADPDPTARCHTNCALRAGRPWADTFVPPPRTLQELVLP